MALTADQHRTALEAEIATQPIGVADRNSGDCRFTIGCPPVSVTNTDSRRNDLDPGHLRAKRERWLHVDHAGERFVGVYPVQRNAGPDHHWLARRGRLAGEQRGRVRHVHLQTRRLFSDRSAELVELGGGKRIVGLVGNRAMRPDRGE